MLVMFGMFALLMLLLLLCWTVMDFCCFAVVVLDCDGTHLILQLLIGLLWSQHLKEGGAELLWTGGDHVPRILVLVHLLPKDVCAGVPCSRPSASAAARTILGAAGAGRLAAAYVIVEEALEAQADGVLVRAVQPGRGLVTLQRVAVMREGDVAAKNRAGSTARARPTGILCLNKGLNLRLPRSSHKARHRRQAGLSGSGREGAEHVPDGAGLLRTQLLPAQKRLEQEDSRTLNGILAMVRPNCHGGVKEENILDITGCQTPTWKELTVLVSLKSPGCTWSLHCNRCVRTRAKSHCVCTCLLWESERWCAGWRHSKGLTVKLFPVHLGFRRFKLDYSLIMGIRTNCPIRVRKCQRGTEE